MRIFSYILFVLIVIFGVTFAALNSESVTINYYFTEATMPLSMLLVLVFSLGSLVGMLIGFWMVIKAKFNNYRIKQKLADTEKQMHDMQSTPLRDKI